MTVLEGVSDLLKQYSPRPLCDDCIAQKLGLTVRQHANHKTRELQHMRGFDRRTDTCAACGAEKLVIRFS